MIARLYSLTAVAAAVSALFSGCQPKTDAPPPAAQTEAPQPPASAAAVASATAAAPAPPPAPLIVEMSPADVQKLLEKRVTRAFVPGEVVVKMKASARARTMAAADMTRLQVVQAGEQLTSGGEQIFRIAPTVASAMAPQAMRDRTLALVKTLAARPDVQYAQPNYIFQIGAVPNDPLFVQQWHYLNNGSGPNLAPGGINLPQVWDTNKGSDSVVVAVIDTGILPNHPDITGSPNLVAGYDMITDPFIANDGGGRDNDPTDPGDAIAAGECGTGSPAQGSSWHGTHVAGTIGVGNTNNGIGVAGINWNVKLQMVRVLGKCGGTMVDINDAIRWAAGLPVPGTTPNATPARSST